MIVTTGTGLTSCLSTRLHDAHVYARYNGHWPQYIDSSAQFDIYKAHRHDRVDEVLLGKYSAPLLTPTDYDHGWQYGWYDQFDLPKLSRIAMDVCRPSDAVLRKAAEYRNAIGERTCILYRGNDKAKEIAPVTYDQVIKAAGEAGGEYFVQTDEQEFLKAFLDAYPNAGYTDEIPRIRRNFDGYVSPVKVKMREFVINFNAMLWAIGQARKVVMTTGNTGLWTAIYRGHTHNVWQMHGATNEYRKL